MGRRSSAPPGSRTSGRLAVSARRGRVVVLAEPVNGRRLLRAKSSIRIVASDECGPTISSPMPVDLLQRLAPLDERREQQVAERPVLEQQRPQHVAVDGDVAQRLRDDGGEEDGLPGEQVHLAEEAGGAVADDLVAGRVEDRDLALEDRDERVARVADAVEHVSDPCGALLAELGERRQLRRREL